MNHFSLIEGTNFTLNDKRYSVINCFGDEIQIQDSATGRIESLHKPEALARYIEGRLVPHVNQQLAGKQRGTNYNTEALLVDLSEELRLHLQCKQSFVKFFLGRHERLCLERVQKCLNEYWNNSEMGQKPSATTAYRWIKVFQRSNGDTLSLLPKTHNKGNRNQRIGDVVLDICRNKINNIFMTRASPSVRETHREIVATIERENRLLLPSKRLAAPSYTFVRRLIQAIPKYEVTKAREGKSRADLDFRYVKDSIQTEGLNSRWEIDHTTMDVIAIDDDFGVRLTRPTLTTVLEISTKSVMAAWVSFETCSTTRVAQAIKQAILPKTDLKEIYPHLDIDWYGHGLPDLIAYDQGKDFTGEGTQAFFLALDIDGAQMPKERGDKKGGVERVGGILNRMVTERLPGKTFASIDEKPFGYNPKRYACVPLSLIRETLIKMIDLYHDTKHNAINMTPRAKWAEEVKRRPVRLPVSPEFIDAYIGQMETRVLTHTGIEFMNMFYNSSQLNKYFRQHGKHKVQIRFNSEDLGSIIVMSKKTGYFKVPVNHTWSLYATGLGVTAHKHILNELRSQNHDFTPSELAERRSQIVKDVQVKIKRNRRLKKQVALQAPKSETSSNPNTKSLSSTSSLTEKPIADWDKFDDGDLPYMETL